jgi:hypothetical protein
MTSHALTATLLSVDPFGGRSSHGSQAAELVLLAFTVSFLAIRTSARLTAHRCAMPLHQKQKFRRTRQ